MLSLSISLLVALLSVSFNPMGNNIGDVIVYYKAFLNEDFIDTFLNLKFYRISVFQIMYKLDLSVKYYSFISIFLIFSLYSLYLYNFIGLFDLSINRKRNKLLFLTVIFSSIPFFVLSSFENTLAFIFISNGVIFGYKKKKLLCSIFFTLALISHSSSIIFVVIYILSYGIKRLNYSFVISSSLFLVSFLYVIAFSSPYVELPIIGYYTSRLGYYMTGPWSTYIGTLEYFLLLSALCKMVMLYLITKRKKAEKYDDFETFLFRMIGLYLVFCLLFIYSRTLNLRYIHIGFLIFSPYLYVCIMKGRLNSIINSIFSVFLLFSLFSLHNIYYVFGMQKNTSFAPDSFFFSSFENYLNSGFDLPSGRYILQSRKERVDSNNSQ